MTMAALAPVPAAKLPAAVTRIAAFVEGFSVEEIAESLGLNANTVKVRLFRARRKMIEFARHQKHGS